MPRSRQHRIETLSLIDNFLAAVSSSPRRPRPRWRGWDLSTSTDLESFPPESEPDECDPAKLASRVAKGQTDRRIHLSGATQITSVGGMPSIEYKLHRSDGCACAAE